MADNNPTSPGGAVPPKPGDAAKVQPKKETVRITLPPKPTAGPTVKLPSLPGGGPSPSAPTVALPSATSDRATSPTVALPPAGGPSATSPTVALPSATGPATPAAPPRSAPASRTAQTATTQTHAPAPRPTPAPAPTITAAPAARVGTLDTVLAVAALVVAILVAARIYLLSTIAT